MKLTLKDIHHIAQLTDYLYAEEERSFILTYGPDRSPEDTGHIFESIKHLTDLCTEYHARERIPMLRDIEL